MYLLFVFKYLEEINVMFEIIFRFFPRSNVIVMTKILWFQAHYLPKQSEEKSAIKFCQNNKLVLFAATALIRSASVENEHSFGKVPENFFVTFIAYSWTCLFCVYKS